MRVNSRNIALLTAFIGAASLGSAGADEVVRTLDRQVSAADADSIHLDFPVGEVRIDGGAGRQVRVQLTLECDSKSDSRCVSTARGLELISSTVDDRLHIGLKGWPKAGTRGLEAHFVVTLPRDLPLRAELGVGELKIAGMESDVDADLGVGEVGVKMAASAVRSVTMDSGIGEATLTANGHRWESAGLFTKEIDWNKGDGKAEVTVDCGVGEAQVRLE